MDGGGGGAMGAQPSVPSRRVWAFDAHEYPTSAAADAATAADVPASALMAALAPITPTAPAALAYLPAPWLITSMPPPSGSSSLASAGSTMVMSTERLGDTLRSGGSSGSRAGGLRSDDEA
ncbi:hypothetical protein CAUPRSCDRAFT_12353 [Caulochytrium protostelioides]|nr:hypothetical protein CAUPRSCDRAFT_12353 [Caulochytrium protostelioides]